MKVSVYTSFDIPNIKYVNDIFYIRNISYISDVSNLKYINDIPEMKGMSRYINKKTYIII